MSTFSGKVVFDCRSHFAEHSPARQTYFSENNSFLVRRKTEPTTRLTLSVRSPERAVPSKAVQNASIEASLPVGFVSRSPFTNPIVSPSLNSLAGVDVNMGNAPLVLPHASDIDKKLELEILKLDSRTRILCRLRSE